MIATTPSPLSKRRHALLAALLLTTASSPVVAQAPNQDKDWEVVIGSWNLRCFGDRKSGIKPKKERGELMARIADISKNHHIIFFQEVQGSGRSITDPDDGLQHYMPDDWVCDWVSEKTRPSGNSERFSYCLNTTAPTYAGGGPVSVISNPPIDYVVRSELIPNIGNKDPQHVWARPPSVITISIPRPGDEEGPLIIDVYDNHLRPAYPSKRKNKKKKEDQTDACPSELEQSGRPEWMDQEAPRFQSVADELLALQNNLQPTDNGILILGDLNADCKYFHEDRRPGKFDSDEWTWWIKYRTRTNVIARGKCAYDRFIGNKAVKIHYRSHHIEYDEIDKKKKEDGVLVSDHYKISLTLGGTEKSRPKAVLLAAPVMDGAGTKNPKKRKQAYGGSSESAKKPKKIDAGVRNLDGKLPAGTQTRLYIVEYNKSLHYAGPVDIPLKDISDEPVMLEVDPDGEIEDELTWPDPEPGAYKMVLDVDADGILNVYKGDIVNSDTEIDILIGRDDYQSDVLALGDDVRPQDLFFVGKTRNIYGLAKDLPVKENKDVTGYVIAHKLLPESWDGWESFRDAKNNKLADYAVPVNIVHGPIWTYRLKLEDKQIPLTADDNKNLFATIWKRPSALFNQYVSTRRIERRPPLPETIRGSCEDAWKSEDKDLRTICNVDNSFSDHYGTRFNFVIDVDNDGSFGENDVVDTYDIDDLATYFSIDGIEELGPDVDDQPAAVQEYKDFLSARLNLVPPLCRNNLYDEQTKQASKRYLQKEVLTKDDFLSTVTADAEIGFHLVDRETFERSHYFTSRYRQVDDYSADHVRYNSGVTSSLEGDDVDINKITAGNGVEASVRVDNAELRGPIEMGEDTSLTFSASSGTLLPGFKFAAANRSQFHMRAKQARAPQASAKCR